MDVHLHHGRVLVGIGHVLGQVFNHELLCLLLHVCSNEGGEIQVRPAVEIEPDEISASAVRVRGSETSLILQHLVHSIGRSSIVRDLELGELRGGGVAAGVGSVVVHGVVGVEAATVGRMVVELLDEVVGVNVACEHHCGLGCR